MELQIGLDIEEDELGLFDRLPNFPSQYGMLYVSHSLNKSNPFMKVGINTFEIVHLMPMVLYHRFRAELKYLYPCKVPLKMMTEFPPQRFPVQDHCFPNGVPGHQELLESELLKPFRIYFS